MPRIYSRPPVPPAQNRSAHIVLAVKESPGEAVRPASALQVSQQGVSVCAPRTKARRPVLGYGLQYPDGSVTISAETLRRAGVTAEISDGAADGIRKVVLRIDVSVGAAHEP
jgi:hypothetical protein